MLYLKLLWLSYFWFLFPLSHIIFISLLTLHHLYVPIRAIPYGLYHRFDFPVQFLAVFTPKVSFRRVYYEFHMFAAGFKDRVVGENAQLFWGVRGGFGTQRGHRGEGHRVIELLILDLL